ncbi:serine hydrolase domain-containing protein [Phyllobacterium meliloti]|uniref:serine hydrolase domain-containing protein n=1 Tax=Phyllobacterium meliloti TaxID=555317 RepID=UPI001D14FB5A|nr:serine hydrolase domain-containing protein [Phyllobacterium sp. T1293]UGX89166.1 beta-lactamase family protein [Phyllobacterium sp. T1293]
MSFVTALNDYLVSEIDRQQIPGLGVAVVHRGQIVHLSGYGLANIEHRVPVTPDTIFQSGSAAKMFTATAILLLSQDGRIELDHPLTRYIPEGPATWADITIRQMLSMMSGLGNFREVFAPTPIDDGVVPINIWQDYSSDQLIALAALSPLVFQPGESYQYSNIGYVLAGIIIERITGQPYYELLKDRVFRPIGMATAREASWFNIVPNRAAGHSIETGELTSRHWTAPTLLRTADGGLYFSPRDIAHWLIELESPRVLSPELLSIMFEASLLKNGHTAFNNYALGWENAEIRGHHKIRHGGTWDGFRAEIARFPAQGVSVAVLANLQEARVAHIAQTIAGYIDPTLAPYAPIEDTNQASTINDRILLRAILTGRPAPEAFTAEAWDSWSGNGWFDQLIASGGVSCANSSLQLIEHGCDPRENVRHYSLPTEYAYHMHWFVRRDDDGRVSEMRFSRT